MKDNSAEHFCAKMVLLLIQCFFANRRSLDPIFGQLTKMVNLAGNFTSRCLFFTTDVRRGSSALR
jgi:hypothetical protein